MRTYMHMYKFMGLDSGRPAYVLREHTVGDSVFPV